MTFDDFYDLTPREFDTIISAYNENEERKSVEEWERLRVHIYYHYLFTPSSKQKVSYDIFKNDYLKFNYDIEKAKESEFIDEEAFNKMQNYFKRGTT